MKKKQPNPHLDRTGKGSRRTTEEMVKRREEITILRYDMYFSVRAIAAQLKMSIGMVSRELKEINKEFNKPLDPSIRNTFIQEHIRHHSAVIGGLRRDMNAERDPELRRKYHESISACLLRRERFMAQIGIVSDAPIKIDVKHDEEPINEEVLRRFAEEAVAEKTAREAKE